MHDFESIYITSHEKHKVEKAGKETVYTRKPS